MEKNDRLKYKNEDILETNIQAPELPVPSSKKTKPKIMQKALKIAAFLALTMGTFSRSPEAQAYDSLIEAIAATTSPREYTLNANETTNAVLGTMGGANDAVFTVDGGNFGIINGSSNKDARILISKSTQTFNLQNAGSYTPTTSGSIIEGKDVVTSVDVGNSITNFGVFNTESANTSSYVGFLRNAGKSNVTNSVFYNNRALYGAAIQNRESGELSVKNSVFVGNTSQQGAIHNDSAQKIEDISNSIFYNNTAVMVSGSGNNHTASAIFNKATKTIDLITGSTFTNNIATGDSSNIAATIYNAGTIGTITDSIFYNNTSENKGSVIYNAAAGVITTISDSHFVNNTANSGILETIGSISNITDSTFKENTVTKNGIIALYNDTAASTIGIGNINKVQVTDNTGNGIYIRSGKSDATVNITSITGESKFNNNTGSGLYIGGNSGIINITSINNSEFNNNTQRGVNIQNTNNVGNIHINEISNVKINGNQDGGIFLQRSGDGSSLQIDEISNVEIKNNTKAQASAQGGGLRNEGAHIVLMSDVVFDNDTLIINDPKDSNKTQGGAIYNSQYGTIDKMEDITIQNCSAYNGGAIYNRGTISSIVNMTVSDINTNDVMIASEEGGSIETIDNMTIQNSAGTGLSFFGGTGGTIQNSTFTNMYGAGAKMGYGLQVTAKKDAISGHVDTIDNIVVAGNQTGGMRIDDNGSTDGHTANIGLIKNSQFTNNGTTGNNKAGGIWAKTDVLTISADGAGKTTTFKGNKRQGVATGIWMENKNSILNLQQLNSGEMYMYDPINGNSGRYYVNISGDPIGDPIVAPTGTLHLYDDIVNGMVDVQNTNISTIDGKIHNYSFATLSSDANSKYTLDIFFDSAETDPHSTIDTFTISNRSLTPETGIVRNTSGIITLHALNFLNDVDASMIGKSATLQVIKAPVGNSLILENGFELDPEGWVLFTLQDDVKTEYDPVYENTDWSDKIKIYDIATKVLGDVDIITTDTTKDTLKITIAQSTKTKTWTGDYLDTLKAVNQAELDTRNFTTNNSSDIYNVTADLGVTAAGTFNIKGKDSEQSLIDFNETNHYKGFELDNATNLTLENVEVKNSSQLVSGIATDSNINIYNSYLHDNDKGVYLAGNANLEGTTQIDDDFYLMGDNSQLTVNGQIRGEATPANITFNKRLEGVGTPTSAFTFSSGTVTLGNEASVANTNLVLDNTTLNVGANNAFTNVNLTSGNTKKATLNLQNESTGVQNFNTLTLNKDMNIAIDVDLENEATDTLKITTEGAEAVKVVDGHNIIINAIYILTDGEDTETNVVLTDDSRFQGVYELSDSIQITKAGPVSGSYTVSYKDFDSLVDPDKGILIFTNTVSDTLASTIAKNAGEEAIKEYYLPQIGETVEANLGTLIGKKLTIYGNGEAETNFIRGGNTYTGVVIGDGKTQTLEVNNVNEWSGFTDSAIKNRANGTVKINNVNFSSNTTSDIDNGGALEFTGTNTVNKITGSGSTEIVSGATTFTGTTADTITQNSITVTSGTLTANANVFNVANGITNSGTVDLTGGTLDTTITGGNITISGNVSSNANYLAGTEINNASKTLTLTGGDIKADITGSGTTAITGAVTNEGNNNLYNAITLAASTDTLTTGAGTLKNTVANSGTVNLTAGTLESTISGGDITISGDVSSNASNLAGAIANASSNLTLTGGEISGAISGNGTTIIGTGATVANASTSNTIENAVTLNSGSTLTTVAGAIKNTITGVTSPETTPIVELNGGTLGDYTISNAKIVIADDVTANADNLAGTEINNASKTLTLTGGDIKADITGGGTTEITAAVTNTGNNDLNNAINVATTGTLTTGAGTLKNTVANSGTVNLTAGTLATAISGGGETKIIAGSGTVTIGAGSIKNDVTISSGTLASDISKLEGSITNNSIFNVTGDLSKDIGGSGETIINSDQHLATDRKVSGTLNLNGHNINLQDTDLSTSNPAYVYTSSTTPPTQTFQTLEVGSLKGDGSLKIDVDMTTVAGKATKSDKIYIKSGTNNSGTLTLTSVNVTDAGTTSATQYSDYVTYVTGITDNLTITGMTTTITSDNRRFEFTPGSTGKLNVTIREANTTLAQFIQGDNIVLPVTAESFSLTSNLGVTEDLGTTKRDGTPPDPNTLNLYLNNHILSSDGHHAGATVDKGYTLNVDGGTVSGFTTAFATTADTTTPGTLAINNITFSGNTTDIDNDGKTEFTGTNTVNKITGSGSAKIVSGSTTFAGTTADTITQNSITVTSGTLTANANVFNVANGISNSGTVDLTGGTLDTTITGGNITISGDVSSNANNLAGAIANESSTLTLTGGELGNAITGGGATKINGDVTVGAGGSIANVVSFDGTGKQLTASLSQLTGGITVSDDNTLNLQGQIDNGILGTGTVKLNEQQDITSNISYGGTLDINGNTLNMNYSLYDETLTVGKLTGNGNLTLNADASTTTGSSDTINITGADSDSALMVTALNMTTPASVSGDSYTYLKQILTGTPGSATITLSDDVISQYASSTDISKTGTDELHTNNIKWDSNYGEWTEDGGQTTGVSVVDGTKLQYQVTKTYDESSKHYTGKAENLAIMNKFNETEHGSADRIVDFEGILTNPTAHGNYTVNSDIGVTETGKFTINGETDGTNTAVVDFNGHSGFGLDNVNTELVLKDLEVKNSSALVTGNATTGVKVTLNNVNLHDNGSGITTAGSVDIKGNSTIADKIQVDGASSEININDNGTVTLNSSLTGTGASNKLNISNGTVNIGNNASITGLDTTFNNTTLNFASDNTLNGLDATFSGNNNLNLVNNSVNNPLSLGNINLNGVLNMQVDADLANQKMDQISATSAIIGAGSRIDVSKINLMSPTTEKQLDLLFTDNATLAGIVNYTGEGQIVYSPIYKYNTSYSQGGDGKGYFSFVSSGSDYNDFNPAVIASPIAAQAGVMATMNNTFNYAFNNADSFTKLPAQERFLSMNANRYAINEPETKGFASTDFDENLNIDKMYKDNSAIWFRPYTVFENIPLANGPKVEAISYGTLAGFDTDFQHLKNGWNSVTSGYIGYNGAQLSYSGVSSSLNGGLLGATQTFYKKNFWTAVTATTGASVADTNTMYGHEDSTSLFAGIGSKTGYNFEFNRGKFIVQPIWFMSYSFINTFNYTNAAGVRINSKPLNTIQLNPSIRFIGNIKNWQPYAFVGMVWNLMDRTDATANGVKLPEMHIRPYVQYGVGIQKNVGEHFTGFAQATIHNGGRNGIALTGGFRWALGKSSKDNETVKNKNIILIKDKKSDKTDKSPSVKGAKHVIKELKKNNLHKESPHIKQPDV